MIDDDMTFTLDSWVEQSLNALYGSHLVDDMEQGIRDLQDALTTSYCPYFLGVGICETGCRTEPRCITEGPLPIKHAARYLAEAAGAVAHWNMGHGSVKHARDIARWARKIEVAG